MRWEGEEQSENLEDRRSFGAGKAAIGGGAAILVVIVCYFLGVDPQPVNQDSLGNQDKAAAINPAQNPARRRLEEKRSKAFAATILRFTEEVWDEQFRKAGKEYQPPHMVLFSERVETACGTAPSAVGPFYCPADKTVYLDPTFFDELQEKLGGSKAEFSQAYVIAHEVGHHVQNLLGYSALVDQKRHTLPKQEFNQWSVRLELQADYLAGVWAHYGQEKFKFIEAGDVESAIQSANAIGDDRLQRCDPRGFSVSPGKLHARHSQASAA